MRRNVWRWFGFGLAVALLTTAMVVLWPSRSSPPPKVLAPEPEAALEADAPPKAPVAPRMKVDSRMSRREALSENKFPRSILDKMEVLTVRYVGFDGLEHEGQIVVDKDLASEVTQIFKEIRRVKFPIGKVVPVVRYSWDDRLSMADNNTSGFNYRGQVTASGQIKALSNHAHGRAIDINPQQNPYISKNGKATGVYDPTKPGTLTRDSAVVRIFLKRGWKWGGNWSGNKDYQHFEK